MEQFPPPIGGQGLLLTPALSLIFSSSCRPSPQEPQAPDCLLIPPPRPPVLPHKAKGSTERTPCRLGWLSVKGPALCCPGLSCIEQRSISRWGNSSCKGLIGASVQGQLSVLDTLWIPKPMHAGQLFSDGSVPQAHAAPPL